jgi:hypothetical protein
MAEDVYNNRLLTTGEAAAFLGRKPQTLRLWRVRGVGPAYVRMGDTPTSRAGYRPQALEDWLTSRTFRSTAEETVDGPSGSGDRP